MANIRPYIIINDISSESIHGLLISKLAPISKPLMRTKIETISGRDGDIVTQLGYSAYEKVIEIGLTYEYTIDDIIKYFNQSGKIVFSNEPDKYYKFALYKQIDFERLIRFRKAKVSFHVQPFKYSDEETTKTFTSSAFTIRNNGNIYSRPTLTITGYGTINLYINGSQILILNLNPLGETIIINGSEMNAYNESGILLNRQVIGDYDKIILNSGENSIEVTGNVSEIKVDNYSRWI